MTVDKKDFFIAIIGTGPIGLDCGLHALQHGYRFVIFEWGETIAHNIHLWSHVRLFTPLRMNMSPLGKNLLKIESDTEAFLTGEEYIQRYLKPVSELLQANIRLRHRVISVGRYKTKQFLLLVENKTTGNEENFFVDCVIDASGTYASPNFIGPGSLPALNERTLRLTKPSLITSNIPNIEEKQLAGKRILLIGKGHSAATSAITLAKVKEMHPETQLFWIIKQSIDQSPYCFNTDDPLEQRRELARQVNEIYSDKKIFTKIYTNSLVIKLTLSSSESSVDVTIDSSSSSSEILSNIDYIISNTGSQPDRSLYANLSVHECYRTKGPMALAVKLIGSSGVDCLKEISHGAHSLLTTEKNFFILGNKSYGKQVNFLLQIGFEQVVDVFQLIEENFRSIE